MQQKWRLINEMWEGHLGDIIGVDIGIIEKKWAKF
jgi:hypothetical protein